MTFEELRAFLWESQRGQVFDSLICVELGLKEYSAAWDAHKDMATPGEITEDIIIRFLVDVAEYLEINNEDFDKVLESTTK